MKKLLFMAALCLLTIGATAQINTPAPSPAASITQKLGLTDVSVDYSRPSMKGRTVFGNLVPYGKVWRTGANGRTKVTFSTDFTVGGNELKAGTYALFTKPEASAWTVYFYTEYQGGGAPREWDDSKVAAMVNVNVEKMPVNVETFTITIDDVTNDSAKLGILWEDVYVGIPIGVPANEAVLSSIERTINGPSAGDYYNAAVYLASTNQKLDTAKGYMDKAMSMTKEPAYWQLRQQSLLLAKTGDTKGAIKAAKASLEGAMTAGNQDYVKLNKDSLKEWGAK